MRRVTARTAADNYLIEAEAMFLGEDLLVAIWGGTRPHIGAVGAAQPRPSLANPENVSATASVLTYPGHKEDLVVKHAAERIAAELDTNVVVTAGIHWDDLDAAAIDTVVSRCREIVDNLLRQLKPAGGRA
jgi:hypothetical protein